jgi:hypothetical protein
MWTYQGTCGTRHAACPLVARVLRTWVSPRNFTTSDLQCEAAERCEGVTSHLPLTHTLPLVVGDLGSRRRVAGSTGSEELFALERGFSAS